MFMLTNIIWFIWIESSDWTNSEKENEDLHFLFLFFHFLAGNDRKSNANKNEIDKSKLLTLEIVRRLFARGRKSEKKTNRII